MVLPITLVMAMACTEEPEHVTVTGTEVEVVYVEADICISCIVEDALENYIEAQGDAAVGPTTDAGALPQDTGGPTGSGVDGQTTGPTPGGEDTNGEHIPLSVNINITVESLSGLYELSPVVTGGHAVMGVEFYLDGTRLDTDFIPPYSMTLNTASYADGLHTITVYTADSVGQAASDERIVTFDNTAPVFTETLPAEDEVVFFEDRPLTMSLTTEDSKPMELVKMRANGFEIGQFESPPYYLQKPWEDIYIFEDQLPTWLNLRFYARDELGLVTEQVYNVAVHRRFAWEFETLSNIWTKMASFNDGSLLVAPQTVGTQSSLVGLNVDGTQRWSTGNALYFINPRHHAPSDRIITAGNDFWVRAIDSQGNYGWEWMLPGGAIAAGMTLSQDTVFVCDYKGKVYTLDANNGSSGWTVDIGLGAGDTVMTPCAASPDASTVYFGSENGVIYAVNSSGLAWQKQTGGLLQSAPVVRDDGVIFVSNGTDGFMYAQASDGADLWKVQVNASSGWIPTVDPESGDVFSYFGFDDIVRLDGETGNQLWKTEVDPPSAVGELVMGDNGVLYSASSTGRVFALSAETGEILWQYHLAKSNGEVTTVAFIGGPLITNGRLYIGNENSMVYSLNLVPQETLQAPNSE